MRYDGHYLGAGRTRLVPPQQQRLELAGRQGCSRDAVSTAEPKGCAIDFEQPIVPHEFAYNGSDIFLRLRFTGGKANVSRFQRLQIFKALLSWCVCSGLAPRTDQNKRH